MDSMAPQMETASRPPAAGSLRLRLIADDLTGALDTAAQFTGLTGPIPVRWNGLPDGGLNGATPSSIALDSGTRESGRDRAMSTVGTLAARVGANRAANPIDAILYAKLDSLLRGHGGAEIAAWIAATAPAHCIVAPAFPYQGRVTRNGVQLARRGSGWLPAANDLRRDLEREGLTVRLRSPGESVPPGLSLWDAETDADLDAIAAAGLALDGPVLWCGSSGLAGALSRALPRRTGQPCSPDGIEPRITLPTPLPRPLLGLFGTNHPVMLGQLDACPERVLALPDGSGTSAAVLRQRLDEHGLALATLALPDGIAPAAAAERIELEFARLVRRLDPPGTLLVAGGETLHGLCLALEADHLDLEGHIWPGVPYSVLRGGRFDGVRVVSKSGAFGDPALLCRLLALAAPPHQGEQA